MRNPLKGRRNKEASIEALLPIREATMPVVSIVFYGPFSLPFVMQGNLKIFRTIKVFKS